MQFPYLIDGDTRKTGIADVLTYITSTYSPELLGKTPEIAEEVS